MKNETTPGRGERLSEAELKAAYENLDSLIYTISHEMKTPAREIQLYAEFIEEDNAGRLLPQSVQDINSIRRTCDSMMALIQRMMEYSRAGFKVLENKRVDMTLLFRQCFDELMKSCPERSISFSTDPLPFLYGDLFLFRLMITNIISNSIKFTRERENAEISVSSAYSAGGIEIRVRDNGVGFEQKYAGNLFEPFQRLQNEGAYEGNGIGLAIVRRIAERFGGEVGIRGTLNKGCEVRIRFPKSLEYRETQGGKLQRESVKIGIVSDFTGRCPLNEQGKIAAARLAAEEINAGGGILGKPVELIVCDDMGDITLTAEYARRLTAEERVDVLMGSTLSPSRDVLREYANLNKTLYINTQQTEGGEADHYTFCCSAMPEQQMTRMLEYLIKSFGKKCYIITSDYNFGILSAEWAKYLVHELGGEIVGCEYIDDRMDNFSPMIDRIMKMECDILISATIFSNSNDFYVEWNRRGLNRIPIASTTVAAVYPLQKELDAPILENTYVTAAFMEELDTPAARAFTKRFRERVPYEQVKYMGMDTESAYSAMYLYKKAAELARSFDTEDVISAMESGEVYFDGPGGRVALRGSDHHSTRRMSCFRIDERHRCEEVFRTGAISSDYIETMIETSLGVKGGLRTLGANAPVTQYNMLLNKLRMHGG